MTATSQLSFDIWKRWFRHLQEAHPEVALKLNAADQMAFYEVAQDEIHLALVQPSVVEMPQAVPAPRARRRRML